MKLVAMSIEENQNIESLHEESEENSCIMTIIGDHGPITANLCLMLGNTHS